MPTLVLENGEPLATGTASVCTSRDGGGACIEWLAVDVAHAPKVGGATITPLSMQDSVEILTVVLPLLAIAWGFSLLKRQIGVFV